MNIALIAHDQKRTYGEFRNCLQAYLWKCNIYATGHTGQLIKEATGLNVNCLLPGPLGGDQQIGAMIAENKIDMVIF